MEKKQRDKAYELVSELKNNYLEFSRDNKYKSDILELLDDTLKVLNNPNASYKASDYAVSRLYSRFVRLIGFHEVEIPKEVKESWKKFFNFYLSEDIKDIRDVSGPLWG